MNRFWLALVSVAAIPIALLAVSPAAAQRARPPERLSPESFDEGSPARERPQAAPEAASRDARSGESREESEDGWPGGMQERATMPGQARVLPGYPASPRWWLGVYAYNTSSGVVITRVTPNSPAARAGLEPRDRIVTVEGYQVGYVQRRLYPLGPELQLRARPSGQVGLLVQNWRNGELTNMDIRLGSPQTRWPDRTRGQFEDDQSPQ